MIENNINLYQLDECAVDALLFGAWQPSHSLTWTASRVAITSQVALASNMNIVERLWPCS